VSFINLFVCVGLSIMRRTKVWKSNSHWA